MQETRMPFRPGLLALFSGKACFSFCIAFALVFLLPTALVGARFSAPTLTAAAGPTLAMTVGFAGNSRENFWLPASITVSNDGPDFTGVLAATTYTGTNPRGGPVRGVQQWSYQQPVVVGHGQQKQITINVPFYDSPSVPAGIIATLKDQHGKVLATKTAAPFPLDQGSVLIGILSDQSIQTTGFTALSAATLPDPGRSLQIMPLSATTLPDTAQVLDNFDVIVLDDFTTSALNAIQINALRTWVNEGGALLEVGGSQWQRTLDALPPQLLPVALTGATTLPPGTNLLPVGSPGIADSGQAPVKLQQPVPVSVASLPAKNDARQQAYSSLSTVLASGATPLIVQASQGQGTICYLAFDPAANPLLSWPGTVALWKGLLIRTLNDQSLFPESAPRFSSGPGGLNARGGLFLALQPATLLPVWTLLVLLLGYIILIGPVRLLILRRMKRAAWSWRIVLASAVVFSFLTYGLAYYQRSASINSISIVQFNQGGSSAHVTTLFSVFVPGAGSVQVHFPGTALTQPIVIEPFQNDDRGTNITFTTGQDGTTIGLPDAGGFTLHALASEEDQQVQGGLVSHLSLRNGVLSGTVTNTLATALSDVYILMSHSYASIGHLAAGQTAQVNVPLHSSSLTTSATLADQIARDNHLAVPYFPYDHNAVPQNDFQRHLALLAALSGEGFNYANCHGPCSTHAVVSKQVITAPPFNGPPVTPLDSNDALLISGAPATLIGWADQSSGLGDNATINGINSGGTHESLVQVPLNVDFPDLANLPPGLLSGQVVNAQGNGAQIISPNVYNITSGALTFAFTLPDPNFAQLHSMSIAEPFIGNANPGNAQVQLYNWSTSAWEHIALTNNTFSTGNTQAYISSDGHVLLRVGTQSTATAQQAPGGSILFEKPSLSVSS